MLDSWAKHMLAMSEVTNYVSMDHLQGTHWVDRLEVCIGGGCMRSIKLIAYSWFHRRLRLLRHHALAVHCVLFTRRQTKP